MVARTDYSITDTDGEKLDEWCQTLKVRTVLEFGPGYSTNFLARHNRKVVSVEGSKEWHDRLIPALKEMGVELHWFDPEPFKISIAGVDNRTFDLGFVDAPPGTESFSRCNAALYCVNCCRYIALHDTGRGGEKQTAELLKALGWQVIDVFDGGKGLSLFTCAGA